jgi:DNA-binding transcriptional LysR family regulator
MWETVELREVRIFLVLAEELHFGRTAERLQLSQSRVSQAVRSLEAQLGRRLFDRTSRRVRLTPVGQELAARLRGPHDALRDALAEAYRGTEDVEGVLRLTLGSPNSQGPYLMEIVNRFRRRHPRCEVLIAEETSPEWLSVLRDGKADLLTSWLPVNAPDLVRGPIINREERVLAVARGHPLAGREAVTLEEVADYAVTPALFFSPEIADAMIPRFAPSGRPIPRLEREVRTPGDRITLVALGEIVHPTVPSLLRHFGHPGVVTVPLHGLPPMESALLWRRTAADPRIDAFVEIAREVLPAELSRALPRGWPPPPQPAPRRPERP